ncbi:UNVERIFIED_CONTAM: hypothetical protein GTU68_033126 [Idotea baltica]|nr:hypothetical protein [Idotea baltica]
MYIITGGAGFIGSVLVRKLNDLGIDDILIVDNIGTSDKWKNLVNKSYKDYIHKNDFIELLDTEDLQRMSQSGIQGIAHLGACSSTTETNMDYLMENNINFSKALFSYALDNDIPFVYASSAATYGAGENGFDDNNDELTKKLIPANRYGYSKHLFDIWLMENDLFEKATGLKFFNVYGPNEYHKGGQASVCYHAYKQFIETSEIKLFKSYLDDYKDGEQKRDHIYVKDCVDVVWWFLQNPDKTGLFNVGTGNARSWNALAKSITDSLGKPENINYIEMPDRLKEHYQYFTEAKNQKLIDIGCDVKMRSLEEGVKDYVNQHLMNNFSIY